MLFVQRLLPLRHGSDVAYLDFLPQSLKISEVVMLILVFIGRQILHTFGLANQPELKPGKKKGEDQFEIPELSLSMPFSVRQEDLEKYARVVGLHHSEEVLESPMQACLLLCALSMPAMLLLLAHHKSPIRPLGSVNVTNKFEVLHPKVCSSVALLHLEGAQVRSKFIHETRKAKRGLEVDILIEVLSYHGGRETIIFRQIFMMLQIMKCKSTQDMKKTYASEDPESVWSHAISVPVGLTAASPNLWAAICKDYNPIHMSSIAARLHGFPTKIAHGNFALAFARARLESADAFRADRSCQRHLSVTVLFRRPILLLAALTAESAQQDDGTFAFRLMKQDKIYVAAKLKRVLPINSPPKIEGEPTYDYSGKVSRAMQQGPHISLSKLANSTNSHQHQLLTHVYQYFGVFYGCSMQGTAEFPNYQGVASMYEVHKSMDVNKYEMGFFNQQITLAVKSLGFEQADVDFTLQSLQLVFSHRCSPATTVIPPEAGPNLQSVCIAIYCPLDANATCSAYPDGVIGQYPIIANQTLIGGVAKENDTTPTTRVTGTASSTSTAASMSSSNGAESNKWIHTGGVVAASGVVDVHGLIVHVPNLRKESIQLSWTRDCPWVCHRYILAG